MYNLWRFVALNDSKISFVAIYAVLSRIFCCNLRAFVWRKFVQKIVCVEKKRQISGMASTIESLSAFEGCVFAHFCDKNIIYLQMQENGLFLAVIMPLVS